MLLALCFALLSIATTLSLCGSEIHFDSLELAPGAHLGVLEYCQTSSGDLYILYYQGIKKFNFETGKLEPFSYPDDPFAMSFYESKATGRLFIGSRKQLLYSDDGGESWTVNSDSLLPKIDFAHFAEDGQGVLYVATSARAAERPNGAWGVYKSEDNGVTWTLVEAIAAMHEDIIVDEDGTVYVAASTLAGLGGGLYRLRPGDSEFERIVKGRWVEQVQFDKNGKIILTNWAIENLRADKSILDWHTPSIMSDYTKNEYILNTGHGFLWIVSGSDRESELFYLDHNLTNRIKIRSNHDSTDKFRYQVLEAFIDVEDRLWILRQNEGVYRSSTSFESVASIDESRARDEPLVLGYNGQFRIKTPNIPDWIRFYDLAGKLVYELHKESEFVVPNHLHNKFVFWAMESNKQVYTGSLYID